MNHLAVTAMAAATALSLASCGGKKGEAADSALADTIAEEAPAAAADTLPYGAAFFTNPDNEVKAATPDSVKGYKTTASGLRYINTVEGTGVSPKATDAVEVHYTGRLLDGTVFDSSVERGESITFPLQGVIRGWTEGLQLMKEGGTTIFYIPSELAYGQNGTPDGSIPPNAPLIFEVQLIKVNPGQAAQ